MLGLILKLVYNLAWVLSNFCHLTTFLWYFDPLWIQWAWHDCFILLLLMLLNVLILLWFFTKYFWQVSSVSIGCLLWHSAGRCFVKASMGYVSKLKLDIFLLTVVWHFLDRNCMLIDCQVCSVSIFDNQLVGILCWLKCHSDVWVSWVDIFARVCRGLFDKVKRWCSSRGKNE